MRGRRGIRISLNPFDGRSEGERRGKGGRKVGMGGHMRGRRWGNWGGDNKKKGVEF